MKHRAQHHTASKGHSRNSIPGSLLLLENQVKAASTVPGPQQVLRGEFRFAVPHATAR